MKLVRWTLVALSLTACTDDRGDERGASGAAATIAGTGAAAGTLAASSGRGGSGPAPLAAGTSGGVSAAGVGGVGSAGMGGVAGMFAGSGVAGAAGVAGIGATAGMAGRAGASGTAVTGAGAGAGRAGMAGMAGAGMAGSMAGAPAAGSGGGAAPGETGRLVGITAAHNAVRARQMNPMPSPPLPPFTWSADVAMIAQAYADQLAGENCAFRHSMRMGLGENLAQYTGTMATPQMVVEGWAAEQECYTFGTFMRTDSCNMTCAMQKFANGCGHYTQIVWRTTTEVGCGVAKCAGRTEVWVCNYKGPGNYVGQKVF